MSDLAALKDRYPPEHLDLERLIDNLITTDEQLAQNRAALPTLRAQVGHSLEATRCAMLIEEQETQRAELIALVEIKKEWLRAN